MSGKATEPQPCSSASPRAERYAEQSSSRSPKPPPRQTGPTAWMTYFAGRRQPRVMRACPVGQPPRRRTRRRASACGAADGGLHAPAARKVLSRGADYGVHLHGGDVVSYYFERHGATSCVIWDFSRLHTGEALFQRFEKRAPLPGRRRGISSTRRYMPSSSRGSRGRKQRLAARGVYQLVQGEGVAHALRPP